MGKTDTKTRTAAQRQADKRYNDSNYKKIIFFRKDKHLLEYETAQKMDNFSEWVREKLREEASKNG